MRIGVVKEIKQAERRVALTPAGAQQLVALGSEVLVEAGAGVGSGFSDDAYKVVGAQIVPAAAEVWQQSELLLKVKEPIEPEYPLMHADLTMFTYFHLAPDRAQTEAILSSGATAIAYETVETADGRLPLLAPMSEIAGRLAAHAGAYFLQSPLGGPGVLMGGVTGVAPARVLVIGGGVVGAGATRIALGAEGEVTILERSLDRLHELDQYFGSRARILMSDSITLEQELREADVVIGAVLVPGAVAPHLVTREMLGLMKPRSVIVDVAIDQGGCFETSHPTTHAEPVFDVDGVLHYCVANMPGAVPVTATQGADQRDAALRPPARQRRRRRRARRGPRLRAGAERQERRDHLRARRRSLRSRATRSRLVAAPDPTRTHRQTPGPAFTGGPAWVSVRLMRRATARSAGPRRRGRSCRPAPRARPPGTRRRRTDPETTRHQSQRRLRGILPLPPHPRTPPRPRSPPPQPFHPDHMTRHTVPREESHPSRVAPAMSTALHSEQGRGLSRWRRPRRRWRRCREGRTARLVARRLPSAVGHDCQSTHRRTACRFRGGLQPRGLLGSAWPANGWAPIANVVGDPESLSLKDEDEPSRRRRKTTASTPELGSLATRRRVASWNATSLP